MGRPIIIGVGGVSSNVGKTTLMCELLSAFPGWEAIKTTRGHYRSCGKDSEACCVSELLQDEPVLRSGRAETFAVGKDTGRYWDAGASNVHWVIATDTQVEKGINLALARVKTPGVFVEGNSFTNYVTPDYFVMVQRAEVGPVKKTARLALEKTSALFISDSFNKSALPDTALRVFSSSNLPALIEEIRLSVLGVSAVNLPH